MRSPLMLLLAVAAAASVAGCQVFLGTSTSSSGLGWSSSGQDGLTDRCGGDDGDDCSDAARTTVLKAATTLGKPYDGPGLQAPVVGPMAQPGEAAAAETTVSYESEPPFAWSAADGRGGQAARVTVDLTRYLDDEGPAYAVLQGGDGAVARYEVPDELADALIDALWIRPD